VARILLALALAAGSGAVPVPTGVSRTTLWELWDRSDFVVLGRVEKIVSLRREVPLSSFSRISSNDLWRLDPHVPVAEVSVSRVFRGPPATQSLLYLACSTWICDTTQANPGEEALFFLRRTDVLAGAGPTFDAELATTFGAREVLSVNLAGRGRMPLRVVDGRTHVDYWEDVVPPGNVTTTEGPEPERASFVRSMDLDDVSRTLDGYRQLRDSPILTAQALRRSTEEQSWDLHVAEDGSSRVIVHGPAESMDRPCVPSRDRERFFRMEPADLDSLLVLLEGTWAWELPRHIGRSVPGSGRHRRLRIVNRPGWQDPTIPATGRAVGILVIDDDWMADPLRRAWTTRLLRIWSRLRGSFDIPGSADHRAEDGRWLAEPR